MSNQLLILISKTADNNHFEILYVNFRQLVGFM